MLAGEVLWKVWLAFGNVDLSCGVAPLFVGYDCRMPARVGARIWCEFEVKGLESARKNGWATVRTFECDL